MPKVQMTKCSDCGEPTISQSDRYDYQDRVVCDECDQHYEWCNTCKSFVKDAPLCRHLFYDLEGEVDGSGATRREWEQNKYPFFSLLNLFGRSSAIMLKKSLERHKYYHQFSGSIFGVDSVKATWFTKNGIYHASPYFVEVFDTEREDRDHLEQAVNWLVSLYSGCYGQGQWEPEIQTPEQDLLTASWIDAWLVADDCLSLTTQSAFVTANGETKLYPVIHQRHGLKVVKLQWTNHYAVVHPSGFLLPHSCTFDRDKAIAFCNTAATYPIAIYPIYQMSGDSEIQLLQRVAAFADRYKNHAT